MISDGESRTDYLYKCADLALYEAKKEGSGHVQIFRPGMLQRLQENKSFEDDLLQALSLLSADRRYRHARNLRL
ncbi:diguanylate cyclase/cyclic diguanylate phosphodiesterase [Klebsiella pneumoniae]|nr:diguanylate cyclase/cyclic diguanylate phosphodiesterase [Klebsiella pneumoniae]